MSSMNCRTCITCGKKYLYCPSCGDKKLPWKRNACSPRCFEVSTIINKHFYNQMTTEEAMEALIDAGYTDIDIQHDSVTEYISNLEIESGLKKRAKKAHAEEHNDPKAE